MAYKECRICNRVTEHKKIESESKTFQFAQGVVTTNIFYICPHCNTGISGDQVNAKVGGNIISTFDKKLG